MKNLIVAVSFILAVLLFAGNASAQQNRLNDTSAEERAQLQTQRMKETLKLDSLQLGQVASINLSYARKMDPVIAGSGSRLSKLKAYQQINASKEKELQRVLNPDQFKQFKQQQQQIREQLKKRRS